MRKLMIALVVWFSFGFVFAWSDRQTVDEKAELFRKKEALLELVSAKGRVIIAGGSNIFWGVSSETLQDILQRPVINISIPSEIEDPELMRNLALKVAQPGDLVLYSSMSFWLTTGVDRTRALKIAKRLDAADYVMSNVALFERLAFWWRPSPSEVNPATALLRKIANETFEDPWSPHMDEHGDYKACTDIAVSPLSFASRREPGLFADEVNEFRKQLKQKGVLLAATAPWILVDPSEKEQWTDYYRDVMARLSQTGRLMPVGDPNQILREDPNEFCECAWHLKRDPGVTRTISDLKDRVEHELTAGLEEEEIQEEGEPALTVPDAESGMLIEEEPGNA